MIIFRHKKHMHENRRKGQVVIYYNVTDIFLGATLMILVIFFIHDYLSHALSYRGYENTAMINQIPADATVKIPTSKP